MPQAVIETGRTKKSTINILTGLLSQFVILVLNFVVRYIFIDKIGNEYLGINTLFTSILTVISIADLGFGSALGIVLYSSLARKDEEEIAGLMNFFKKVYLVIGIIVTVAGLIITPFVRFLVNTDEEIPHLSLYFLFFLLNTVSSYFVSYRAILIRADQKNSVVNNVTTLVKVIKAILESFVLFFFPQWIGLMGTYIAYLVVMVAATYAIGIITSIYARKKYPYAFNKTQVPDNKKKEIISTTKDLFIYRLCNAFSSPIDSIIISLFVGTALLGIYSNYLLIFTTLLEFICLISRNVISSVGNYVVERPIEDQKKLYFEMQMIYFAVIVFCTINFVALASPFIKLVFKEGNVLSAGVVFLFGGTLVLRCCGELAIIFRETTKIYKKTKYISLVYTVLHIGLSLLLGNFMGLEGILLGNVIAYFASNFWFEIFALFRWYFKGNPITVFAQFLYVFAITIGCSIGMYYLCNYLSNMGPIFFFLCCIISLVISSLAVFALFPLTGFKDLYRRGMNIAKKFTAGAKKFYNSKKAQKYVLIGYFVSLTVLVILRDVFAINIDKFIFFGLVVVFTLLLNKSNAFMLLLFTLPFSPSLAELYILIFALAYLFIVNVKDHKIRDWIVIFAFPTLLLVMEIVLSKIYGEVSINLALRIFVLTSILAVIYYDKKEFSKKHLYAIMFGYLYMLTVMAITWILPGLYGITHKAEGYTWLSMGDLFRECRFGFKTFEWISKNAHVDYPFIPETMFGENPNNIGLISIVCMSTLFALYGTSRRKEKALICAMMVMFLLYGIWSQSRMFVLTFGFFLIFTFVISVITKRVKLIDAAIAFFAILSIIALIGIINPSLPQRIVKRFTENDVETGGGRTTLVFDYFKFVFTDWRYALFGVSCSNLPTLSDIVVPPHANFVQFIGSYGFVTLAVFLALFIGSIIMTKKKIVFRGPYIYLYVPLVFTVIFTFSLQLFLPSIILITFIPSVMCLSFLNKNSEKQLYYYSVTIEPVEPQRKIRVAMCSTSFGGGIGSYIANISNCLVDDNFDVYAVYNYDTTKGEKERYINININKYEYKKKKKKFKLFHLISKYNYFSESFDKCNPDIIYINLSSYITAAVLILAAKMHRTSRIVLHCHNAVNSKSKLPFKERFFASILGCKEFYCFACSKEAGKVFYGKKFLDNPKTEGLINNYIDTNRFKFNKNGRFEIRKKLKIQNDELLLGAVGRIVEEKNHIFLIELIKNLPDKYKLVIVGDGQIKPVLMEKVISENLSDRIIFVSNNNEVEKYYCAFDYFCLPSLIEGLPFVSVEAQCSGLINIVSSELPASTAITNKVVFLPLDIKVWEQFILNTKPTFILNRHNAYVAIENACYSNKTAPAVIVKKIKDIAYE